MLGTREEPWERREREGRCSKQQRRHSQQFSPDTEVWTRPHSFLEIDRQLSVARVGVGLSGEHKIRHEGRMTAIGQGKVVSGRGAREGNVGKYNQNTS